MRRLMPGLRHERFRQGPLKTVPLRLRTLTQDQKRSISPQVFRIPIPTHGGVIRRTGTGEVPVNAVPDPLLPQPDTFITVTFTLPKLLFKLLLLLMNTCRKPMIVTLVVLPELKTSPGWLLSSMGKETIELLLV